MDTKYWFAVLLAAAFQRPAVTQTNPEPAAHERADFRFTVDLPYASAAPLFGAWEEQKWAPEWKPHFLYPNPPADREGAVFRVSQGASHSAVWMTTVFDLAAGHVQHVHVLNGAMFTKIDIHLARNGETRTDVSVAYEWTALDPAANDHVRSMARRNGVPAGEAMEQEWRSAIQAYAASLRK